MSTDPVLDKLTELEEKISKQSSWWRVYLLSPLLVAVVAGWITHCSSVKQTRLQTELQGQIAKGQAKFQNELQTSLSRYQADLAGYMEQQKQFQQDRAEFFKNAKSDLVAINEAFEAVSRFPSGPKNEALENSLEKYRRRIETAPYGTRPGILKKLQAYGDFVARKWLEYDKGMDDPGKIRCYEESKAGLEKARRALERFRRARAPF